MYEKIKFDELFENKRSAVVCYLSLERKYLHMMKYHQQICRGLKIKPKVYLTDNKSVKHYENEKQKGIIMYSDEREAFKKLAKWVHELDKGLTELKEDFKNQRHIDSMNIEKELLEILKAKTGNKEMAIFHDSENWTIALGKQYSIVNLAAVNCEIDVHDRTLSGAIEKMKDKLKLL